jgi:hypothetical protein
LCGLSGVIHSYDLSKASVHDINYLQDVRQVYHDCNIIGDKGYLSADIQLDLFEMAHIRLECPYRKNQKDRKPIFVPFAKARKRIETIFSQLTDQFMIIRNYAKETDGLFARVIGKISAQTFLKMMLIEFSKRFPDEAFCEEYLKNHRGKVGVVCKHCGGHQQIWDKYNKYWTCKGCPQVSYETQRLF